MQPVTALDAIEAAYQGATVGQVFEANRVFSVAAILDLRIRQVPEEIGPLLLANSDRARVKLGEVADIYQRTDATVFGRDG